MKFSRVEMLETMKNRDSRYDGVFFVGVRTMKIYCLPSCKAKLPLHKNVVFFSQGRRGIGFELSAMPTLQARSIPRLETALDQ